MKKTFALLIAILLNSHDAVAQKNLVLDPGFEGIEPCIELTALPNDNRNWLSPTSATPDHYTSKCGPNTDWGWPVNIGGFQYPHSGVSYTGAFVWGETFPPSSYKSYREYIEGTLSEPLKAGKTYEVSFWISLSFVSLNRCLYSYSIRNFGAYFSKDRIYEHNKADYFNFSAQIEADTMITNTEDWVKICGRFTAHGGERYIILGNFRNDLTTDTMLVNYDPTGLPLKLGYYYVDDVSVVETNFQRLLPRDTTLCGKDYPFSIKTSLPLDSYVWNTGAKTPTIKVDRAGTYYVKAKANDSECLFYDTINLKTVLPLPNNTLTDSTVCLSNLPVVLSAPKGLQEWHWSDGSSNEKYEAKSEGWQVLSGKWICGNYLDSMYLTVDHPIEFDLKPLPKDMLCQDGKFSPFLYNPELGLPNYSWSNGDKVPSTLISAPGIYTLTTTNKCGVFQDSISFQYCNPAIYIPNVFAPDAATEINRCFIPFGENIRIDYLKIFDRTGSQVYHEANPLKGWDGTANGQPCHGGVYLYVIGYTKLNSGISISTYGNVTLLR